MFNSHLLHYETCGDGKPLILLHGFGANSYTWRHVVPMLPVGYKAYALDLKGFGKSAKPLDKFYSMDDQANLVCDFIEENALKQVTLIGHSMGGGIALMVAMKLIDKEEMPSSLVLIDSVSFPQPMPIFITLLRTPILNRIAVAVLPAVTLVRWILNLSFYDDRKITGKMVRVYAAPIAEPGARHALLQTAQQIIPNDIPALVGRYPSLKMPTLILWGREDVITPLRLGEQLHQVIANSKFCVFDSCGHIPHEEVPERSIPVIVEFLDKNK